MEELITWAAALQEKDIVLGVFMTFGIGFILFLLGFAIQCRLELSSKRTLPHTMSESEYVIHNHERFSTKKGDTGAGYSSSTGTR